MTSLRHPNVHQAWSAWSEDATLHVVACYFNPFRYRNRRQLFLNFVDYLERCPNVKVQKVEVAFGERPFEVTDDPCHDVQLRSDHALWLKENAINIGIARLPASWKYAAYVDADFMFSRHDWALEAIHMLQHYHWVQLFSGYSFLSLDHKPIFNWHGFAYAYHNFFDCDYERHRRHFSKHHHHYGSGGGEGRECREKPKAAPPGATGAAWAFTRRAFELTRGLLDTCILGSADWHMSFGLIGSESGTHPESQRANRTYLDSIEAWKRNAFKTIEGRIGYIDNFGLHLWHGDVKNRGYSDRWQILTKHDFNPATDIYRDSQGVLRWSGNKPQLELDVMKYFTSRSEDSTELLSRTLY